MKVAYAAFMRNELLSRHLLSTMERIIEERFKVEATSSSSKALQHRKSMFTVQVKHAFEKQQAELEELYHKSLQKLALLNEVDSKRASQMAEYMRSLKSTPPSQKFYFDSTKVAVTNDTLEKNLGTTDILKRNVILKATKVDLEDKKLMKRQQMFLQAKGEFLIQHGRRSSAGVADAQIWKGLQKAVHKKMKSEINRNTFKDSQGNKLLREHKQWTISCHKELLSEVNHFTDRFNVHRLMASKGDKHKHYEAIESKKANQENSCKK